MTQITTSERTAVISSYPNAKVFYANQEWFIQSFWKRGLIGLSTLNDDEAKDKIGVWCESDCSLLLRNISALTDAEAIMFYNSDCKEPVLLHRKMLHLHQLQNLYYALTGTELTVNL